MEGRRIVWLWTWFVGMLWLWEHAAVAAYPAAGKAGDQATGVILSGTIRSTDGKTLEGATVSAKGQGKTITTSVFTDEKGVYFFPPLEKGKYRVWSQAVGFETGWANVELRAGPAAQQNFVLKKGDYLTIERQMTGAEWFASLPEDNLQDRRMKNVFKTSCTHCHQPSYLLQNRFDKAGWGAIVNLMSRTPGYGGTYGGDGSAPHPIIQYHKEELVEYLAKARGPDTSNRKYNLQSRPRGEAARAVITEYDVEPADTPGEYPAQDGSDWSEGVPSSLNGVRGIHDADFDLDGNIWVVNGPFRNPRRTYAKIDAATGELTPYRVTDEKGQVRSSPRIRRDDKGILWFPLSGSGPSDGESGAPGSLARLDPRTGKLDTYTPPEGMSGVQSGFDVDGKGGVWASTRTGAVRFDPVTGNFTEFKSLTFKNEAGTGNTYGATGDSEGNGYWAEMAIDIVGKGELATGKVLEIAMAPRSDKKEITTEEDRRAYAASGSDWTEAVPWAQAPRRLSSDRRGNAVWVANYFGENLAKIDTRTNKVTYYPVPHGDVGPYATVVDRNHTVWVNFMNNDSVGRFDPVTETWTEFMLPTHGAETRHISILDTQDGPLVAVTYWRVGKVARLQFRTEQQVQALKAQVMGWRARSQGR